MRNILRSMYGTNKFCNSLNNLTENSFYFYQIANVLFVYFILYVATLFVILPDLHRRFYFSSIIPQFCFDLTFFSHTYFLFTCSLSLYSSPLCHFVVCSLISFHHFTFGRYILISVSIFYVIFICVCFFKFVS